jgi:hypothetical protein
MLKKLFRVLVVGGTALVGATKCGPNLPAPQSTDGGTPPPGGGGPPGW